LDTFDASEDLWDHVQNYKAKMGLHGALEE